MNLDMKRMTVYCNVKETVPGSQHSYQASDLMWPDGQSIPEERRERERERGGGRQRQTDRIFHNVCKGARQIQVLERQKRT